MFKFLCIGKKKNKWVHFFFLSILTKSLWFFIICLTQTECIERTLLETSTWSSERTLWLLTWPSPHQGLPVKINQSRCAGFYFLTTADLEAGFSYHEEHDRIANNIWIKILKHMRSNMTFQVFKRLKHFPHVIQSIKMQMQKRNERKIFPEQRTWFYDSFPLNHIIAINFYSKYTLKLVIIFVDTK